MGTELLTTGKAAKILGLTKSMILHMARKGLINIAPARGPKNETYFRAEDVYALLELRTEGVDLSKVASIAIQARAQIASLERRLNEITELLGLETIQLGTTEKDVVDLYLDVKEQLGALSMSITELTMWAKKLRAIDESYLKLVSHYTADENPWAPYLTLANILVDSTASIGLGKNMAVAATLASLVSARDNLRAVSYFYVHGQRGARAASKLFPKLGNDDDILTHISS